MDITHAQLDTMDIQVLSHLKEDGRKSFTDISNEMNVSVGMIRNRYQKLVESKILHIVGWADPLKVGLEAYARLNLKVHPAEKINTVCDQLVKIPEVSFVAITSGNYNIEINMTCKNNKHLLDTVISKVHAIEGITDSNTTMYMDVRKWAAHAIEHADTVEK
ncbi:AsnC family transcriptional regulator [Flammeovirga yaeyamensis]|uniref:AsnC family transcriptional regulator n=1 Tax=Flammeovirga yaeyamensis TaxID=367791 RepID=A0AAX1N7X6_9BACT|nr:Lrp/AsnC family transcriptional regulator [Flammeovirga yaeyamensis]MBB3698936.1 Lrp/AsnC family transcriptional regulator for asnA, asnC and gidA [Flammeovirga yaeyamensis]NMF36370.1 Lrp/AsnC family transcriptional regulator [Flammeovirga yaeyamensis]QWG03669.1 AsnC family transcriptional regulator [Flammeovirga yaeyamensis]